MFFLLTDNKKSIRYYVLFCLVIVCVISFVGCKHSTSENIYESVCNDYQEKLDNIAPDVIENYQKNCAAFEGDVNTYCSLCTFTPNDLYGELLDKLEVLRIENDDFDASVYNEYLDKFQKSLEDYFNEYHSIYLKEGKRLFPTIALE